VPAINYGNSIQLIGYRSTPGISTWRRGTTIALELFWNPIAQTDEPLKIFLHLLGPQHDDRTLWAQDDQLPKDGQITSTSWSVNHVFRDVYSITIPHDAAAGSYVLTVGLYSETTGDRIPPRESGSPLDPDSVVIIDFSPRPSPAPIPTPVPAVPPGLRAASRSASAA
jgi:hypothetical protein